jgi:hypothetical protein
MQDLCNFYRTLIDEDKAIFIKMLARNYGAQQEDVRQYASMLATTSQVNIDINSSNFIKFLID